jgi:predicted permease
LVLSQIALGVVLVIGAGLLVRTFLAMQRVDPGFTTDQRLTFRLSVPGARYRSAAAINDFSQRLQTSLAALPGVTGVGGISHLPYDDLPNWGGPYLTAPGQDESRAPNADYRAVTSGLFAAIDARLIEGRAFTDADDTTAPPVVIVDDLLASRAWPGQDAVGRQISLDPGSSGHATNAATVVGVVHHLRLRSVVEDLTEQVFVPERQVLRNPLAYVVRTSGDPAALADDVRRAMRELDPLLPIYDVRLLDSYAMDARGRSRFTATLALGMAAIALGLAAIGIYGIVAYSVARRRGEFGVRLALGARPAQLVRLALRDGATIAAIGVITGVAAGLVVARLLRTQLFGVSPFDPLTFAGASLTLGAVVLLACWIPARRAATVNPTDALRG